jgi:hypothetical protein
MAIAAKVVCSGSGFQLAKAELYAHAYAKSTLPQDQFK